MNYILCALLFAAFVTAIDNCEKIIIGSNSGIPKTYTLDDSNYICPPVVNKDNWLTNNAPWVDTFAVSQNGLQISVVRTDNPGSENYWGMDLQFNCCLAPAEFLPNFEVVGNGWCTNSGSRISLYSGWETTTIREDNGADFCEEECIYDANCIGYITEDGSKCQLIPGSSDTDVDTIEGFDTETRNWCWRKNNSRVEITNIGGVATGEVTLSVGDDLWTNRPGRILRSSNWVNPTLIQMPWDKTGETHFTVQSAAQIIVFYFTTHAAFVDDARTGLTSAGFSTSTETVDVVNHNGEEMVFETMQKYVTSGTTVSFTIPTNANWGCVVLPNNGAPAPVPCTDADDCSGQGTASGDKGACSCACATGWKGDTCDAADMCTDADDCSSQGTASGPKGACSCACSTGWKGDTCAAADMCDASDCSSQGTATGQRGACGCTCNQGYKGNTCELDDPCTDADDCSGNGVATGRKGSCTCACAAEYDGAQCENQIACSVFDQCADDARNVDNALTVFGVTWETCCQCDYGVKTGHSISPLGKFNLGDQSFTLSMDFPKHYTVNSIVWKAATNNDLKYLAADHGNWTETSVNNCRDTLTIKEHLKRFFGDGSKFHLKDGNMLVSEVEVRSQATITEYFEGRDTPITYQRSYREDVAIIVGLSRTKTVSATVQLKPSTGPPVDLGGGLVYIEGYANDMDTDANKITLTLHIQTGPCVEEDSVKLVGGGNHVKNEAFRFYDKSFSDGVCTQTCEYFFTPKDYFSDTIILEFTQKHAALGQGKFQIEAAIEYIEASVLDYIPFDTDMKFYKTTARTEEATYYRLGNHVYATIEASPLVAIPIVGMTLNTLVTKQTPVGGSEVVTDILNDATTTYSFVGSYNGGETGAYNFEFDLESLHFIVSVNGEPCIVEGEITISYKDGSTIRRQLRRELQGSGKSENVEGEFMITAGDAVADTFVEEVKTNQMIDMTKMFFMAVLGASISYAYFASRKKTENYAYLLHEEEVEI